MKPTRTHSRNRSQSSSTQAPSQQEDTLSNVGSELPETPCIEEPCVQQICDYMGYAIVDKSKQREPPLPPPTRRKRSAAKVSSTDQKFSTAPRQHTETVPVRPLRNYSTLVPRSRKTNVPKEEKENVDITQYIEIEDDDHNRDLQSGVIIQKMKDRPLPAPPRPPRKSKDCSKYPFKDITHISNLELDEISEKEKLFETEVSVQTEPLPDGFVCEEIVGNEDDTIITKSIDENSMGKVDEDDDAVKMKSINESAINKLDDIKMPRKFSDKIPMTEFEHQETITRGSLVVAPIPQDFREGPVSMFSRSTERVISIKREIDTKEDGGFSEIPEDFEKFKNHAVVEEKLTDSTKFGDESKEIKKIQMLDLDVDRLTVNELLANKITVSDIDSGNLSISEITPRHGGNIILNGVELPANFLQDLIIKLQSNQTSELNDEQVQNKKYDEKVENIKDCDIKSPVIETVYENQFVKIQEVREIGASIVDDIVNEAIFIADNILAQSEGIPIEIPTSFHDTSEEERLIEELRHNINGQKKTPLENVEPTEEVPPRRPPRHSHPSRQRHIQESTESVDPSDIPPPRPPQPEDITETIYLRSQPPPNFYMLKSPFLTELLDEDGIDPGSRKRRHHRTMQRSSSEEAPPTPRTRRRRSEPSIPQLVGQLTQACSQAGTNALKRLIKHLTNNVLRNADGQQDLHVMVVMLLVLIAGLILAGWGNAKVEHYHHWEYFNPPTDL